MFTSFWTPALSLCFCLNPKYTAHIKIKIKLYEGRKYIEWAMTNNDVTIESHSKGLSSDLSDINVWAIKTLILWNYSRDFPERETQLFQLYVAHNLLDPLIIRWGERGFPIQGHWMPGWLAGCWRPWRDTIKSFQLAGIPKEIQVYHYILTETYSKYKVCRGLPMSNIGIYLRQPLVSIMIIYTEPQVLLTCSCPYCRLHYSKWELRADHFGPNLNSKQRKLSLTLLVSLEDAL